MQLSVSLPGYTADGFRPSLEQLLEFAKKAEKAGFDGLWQSDHLVKPPTYNTSWLDPFTTLASVVSVTESIPIGTGILVLPLRNPVFVADQTATLQHLSKNRFSLGVGLGYVQKEFDAAGIAKDERVPRLLEGIELLNRLSRKRRVNFEGEYFELEDFSLEPFPEDPPRILAAGGNLDPEKGVPRSVKERVLRADGWISPPRSPEVIEEIWAEIEEYIEENGKEPEDIDRLHLQYLYIAPNESSDSATTRQLNKFREFRNVSRFADTEKEEKEWFLENYPTGSVEEITAKLDKFQDMGTDELILAGTTSSPEDHLQQLEYWKEHILPRYR
jgi:alkanesulfonate monooxygenase